MALVLSHMRGTWMHSSPKSLKLSVIQSNWELQLAAATYSASVVDWATLDCLRDDEETSEEPKNWQVPEVDFQSTRHPAKSASEKSRSKREEDTEYQRPTKEYIEDTWKFVWLLADVTSSVTPKMSAQTHRELYVRPRRRQVQEGADPVLLLVHGLSILVCVQCCSRTHRCDRGLESSILNFLRMSFVYLAWSINVPSLACLIWNLRKNYNSPIIDILNYLLMSSAILRNKEWDEPLKTILSTYTVDGRLSYQSSYEFARGQIHRRCQGTLLPSSGEAKVSNPWNNVQRKNSI
jgi:hypothetical protein